MELVWVFVWVLMAVFAVGYFAYLIYQLIYRLKNLSVEAKQLQVAADEIQRATEAEVEFSPAEPTDSNELFELLGQRRKRKRQIERKKVDRRRRLIARISKIEIDERFR